MSFPVRTLPVVQNWDCHATGTCCKEYRVTISDDERQRIEAQNWSAEDLGGMAPFRVMRAGLRFWDKITQLNDREDGSCVFLSEAGRCRIHEKFGYEAKPLPCRLFPFVLVPAGDHWRVSVRFACPSAARSLGRSMPEHQKALNDFAINLALREKLQVQPDGTLAKPPEVEGTKYDWPDVLRLVDFLLAMILDKRHPVELRLRKCLHLAEQMRKAKVADVRSTQLGEFLKMLRTAADQEVPANPMLVTPPDWVARILFRQATALYLRKDHGPNRGQWRSRLALLQAALRFARGAGRVPRLHRALPEATFEEAETPRGPTTPEVEQLLERYYTIKIGSLQFCGPASFGLPFWEGLEALAMTLPAILWTARLFRDVSREQATQTALTIVDDHVGFNRVLAGTRQRLSFSILARSGRLAQLIAWYSR